MYLQIMCSRCGHRSRKFKYDRYARTDAADEIVKAGWNSFGDAFYCKKCSGTWEERNGKDRPLWGADHTKERVHQVMIGELLEWIEYQKTGEFNV